jgi:hypothetical protein
VAFALTDAERRLFGVQTQRDEVRLRPTGWLQLGSGAQMAVAGALFLLLVRLGRGRALLAGVAAAGAVGLWALLLWVGTVVASPDGLRVWWFGFRRIPWDQIEAFDVLARAPWWASGWPPFLVVSARMRDGRSVTLWPARSTEAAVAGAESAAAVQCGLLERYRATLAR